MKKISSSGATGLLIKFIIKAVILTAISVMFFSWLFSFIIFKLDLDIKYLEYASYAVNILSSVIISYISVKSFKNNGFVMGMLSAVPLIIFSFINLIVNGNNIVHFLVKLLAVLLISGVFGYLSAKKSKKIKVK
ncbi:MAG: TIGR04086 family membrane protein [Eubacterium sp.]|jgi:putative membrane protein (TIGR04086 family)|nr:TIGR04086 family membrane protein [Eubacterium sp.]